MSKKVNCLSVFCSKYDAAMYSYTRDTFIKIFIIMTNVRLSLDVTEKGLLF